MIEALESVTLPQWILTGLATMVLAAVPMSFGFFRSIAVFCWACFVKPFSSASSDKQQDALDHFYKGQAHIYDATRNYLLKGRKECLQLAVAHLPANASKLVWVDIGGGTGSNIELMDSILSIEKHFDAVYLVDLSSSLCEVARRRFEQKSWGHKVHVLEADACDFSIAQPEADLVTFSYSLSMIPNFHVVVDKVSSLLKSEDGVIGCVDFGIQSADTAIGRTNTLGGLVNRNIPWFVRNFWRIWFETDRVFLDSARRNYLEYKFGTVKALNCYNKALGKIPYYIWVGCDKSRSHQILHRINCLATESPYLAPAGDGVQAETAVVSKGHEAALHNYRMNLPFPSLYYQRQAWRVYYDELNPQYHQFNNQYIYAFTWEDPREDHRILNFSADDTVLAITSAGDNILSYASLPSPPRKIHAVDLNPCQNHLLELKLAALKGLGHDQMWKVFGEGRIANFRELLYSKMSPYMSSQAVQFWSEKGADTFDVKGKGLYDTGFTRWALRSSKAVFTLFGVGKYIDELCSATTMKEQIRIWESKVKPAIFNPFVASVLIGNPLFLWKALGVPKHQAEMIGDSVLRYLIDTLEPVIHRSLLSSDNYFYYLCLKGKYAKNNCPDYLTEKGFRNLTAQANDGSCAIDNIRLHTDTLNDVFGRLSKKSITIAIIMDHMDWFDPKKDAAEQEILAVKECLVPGGRVMLRSAAQYPWYIKTFEKCGFSCKPAGIRHTGESIDRINMYASTWVCTKTDEKRPASARPMSKLKI